mmetsp:Transcript_5415/g.9794  ORF Transcript_5415/g.9794 Transcript_5415/m.9794 type:complete len:234 (-) Transcript_5415:106-807(-)
MLMIDLANTSAKHDRLEPLSSLTIWQPLPKSTRVTLDQWLPKFVSIIRCAVACVYQNLQRGSQAFRIYCLLVLPGMKIIHVQIADAITSGTSTQQRTDTRGVGISHSPTSPRLCSRIGSNRAGKVMRLCGKENIVILLLELKRTGLSRPRWFQPVHTESLDCTGIIFECDHAVAWIPPQGILNNIEEALVHLLPVDGQLALKEPMSTVLAVGLAKIKQLHIGRVSSNLIAEQV